MNVCELNGCCTVAFPFPCTSLGLPCDNTIFPFGSRILPPATWQPGSFNALLFLSTPHGLSSPVLRFSLHTVLEIVLKTTVIDLFFYRWVGDLDLLAISEKNTDLDRSRSRSRLSQKGSTSFGVWFIAHVFCFSRTHSKSQVSAMQVSTYSAMYLPARYGSSNATHTCEEYENQHS